MERCSDNKDKIKNSKLFMKKTNNLEINYENYINKRINLKSFKLTELKESVRKFKLRITGSKPILISRLETFFNNTKFSIIIQKWYRCRIVKKTFRLRGPAFKNRKICLNDTDFITLEPLDEISFENFYSYKDDKNFVYGFNIVSLMQSKKQNDVIRNPYNREILSNNLLKDIISLYNLSYIIFDEFRKENEKYIFNKKISMKNFLHENSRHNSSSNDVINIDYNPNLYPNIRLTNEQILNYHKLKEIRKKPIEQRINELFIEIDMLGNYTQSSWFSNLELRGFNRLYRFIYDIWYHRSQLSNDVRNRICPYHSPFDGIFTRPVQNIDLTIEQMKMACLIVFENMIYSGINMDYKKIGCFHALSGLTIVSIQARMAMPWLYESVVYN
jgi:hypothetical protein